MGISFRHTAKIGWYVIKNRLLGRKRYPLVLMLEPLFRCNLACKGCGKIQHPVDILRKNLSVEDCMQAARECPAPVIAIAGGEPLIHPQITEIIDALLGMGRILILCTNGLPLKKKMDALKPHPNLTINIHMDGLRDHHDAAVCQEGVFDEVTAYIPELKKRGFRVGTNTTIFDGHDVNEARALFDYLTDLGVDACTISPGYAYEKAPDQEHFLQREKTRQFFRALFDKPAKKWPIVNSRFYLEFLMGGKEYPCTPWGNPCRSVLGWQRPCYLMASDLEKPYASSFSELMNDTEWSRYGTGNHPKCAQCMAHCGYEASAVTDTVRHPINMILGGRRSLPKPPKKLLAADAQMREQAARVAAANGGNGNGHHSEPTADKKSDSVRTCGSAQAVQKSPF